MYLSRDERRELAEIDQFLSQERELAAVTALFAEPPRGPGLDAVPPERVPGRSTGRIIGVLVGLAAVAVAVVAACVVASLAMPAAIAVGAVLVVCCGGGLAVALVRYAYGCAVAHPPVIRRGSEGH
jgi:hypothetical protein